MRTYADKTQVKKSPAVSTAIAQKRIGGSAVFQFVNNRPEVIEQSKLQATVNDSPMVKQWSSLQELANFRSNDKGAAQIRTAPSELDATREGQNIQLVTRAFEPAIKPMNRRINVGQTVQRMKLPQKDHKKIVGQIKDRIGEDYEDEEIAGCIDWVENKEQLNLFTANTEAFEIYLSIKGTHTAKALRAIAAADDKMLDEAKGILSAAEGNRSSAAAEASAKPAKPSKAERREAGEVAKAQAAEKDAAAKKAAEKDAAKQERTANMTAYDKIFGSLTDPIALAAWNLARGQYITSGSFGQTQLTLGGLPKNNGALTAALNNWRSIAGKVGAVNGSITGISTFKEPQNKADKGGGAVGSTLETREVQANFILYFGTAYINVHVNQA